MALATHTPIHYVTVSDKFWWMITISRTRLKLFLWGNFPNERGTNVQINSPELETQSFKVLTPSFSLCCFLFVTRQSWSLQILKWCSSIFFTTNVSRPFLVKHNSYAGQQMALDGSVYAPWFWGWVCGIIYGMLSKIPLEEHWILSVLKICDRRQ